MQANVNISAETLNWVVAHTRMDELPQKVIEYFDSWMNGTKAPTFNQVEKVSKATGIPLGYFFLKSPPKEDMSLVDYRTIDSIELENPSRNLLDTIHDMDQIQEWMRNELISNGASELSFVGSMKEEANPEKFAQRIREILEIDVEWYKREEPFNFIRNAVSTAGIIVMMSGIVGNNTHRTLDINEFRAFSSIDKYAPLIFINVNDSPNGKLFSLVHEFAHICMGENNLFNDRYSIGGRVRKSETICNAVASEILVPQRIFISTWNIEMESKEGNEELAIQSLAQTFKCGVTVIARKAYDNKFIQGNLYQKIAMQAVRAYNEGQRKNKERGNGGGNYYTTVANRIDRRFFKMLVSSVQEGKTFYSDAFRLTNTNRSTFAKLIDTVGGVANE